MSELEALAAAIRRGAALRPQTRGQYYAPWRNTFASCALGAAWEGSRSHPYRNLEEAAFDDPDLTHIKERFPVLSMPDVVYPVDVLLTATGESELWHVITQLNDYYHWTREAIADWLSGLAVPADMEVAV